MTPSVAIVVVFEENLDANSTVVIDEKLTEDRLDKSWNDPKQRFRNRELG
jgi:hypothetical protein